MYAKVCVMDMISIPSAVIAPHADRPLTPAMTAVLWEVASLLDERRDVPMQPSDAVWLTCPARRLRRKGREDNTWLREVLDRLTGVRIRGEHRGEPWGAVMVAEWRITEGGARVDVLVPPAAVAALRAPRTFAQVEAQAVHSLGGHGARLYALLADRRRQQRPSWTYELAELRQLLGVADLKSYERYNSLRERVLVPAVATINDLGTVELSMTPIREGRSVRRVRFDWRWKSPQDAADTVAEGQRHSSARRRTSPAKPDAPPLVVEPLRDPAAAWWGRLTDAERESWADRVGRTLQAGDMVIPRKERDIREDAFAQAQRDASVA